MAQLVRIVLKPLNRSRLSDELQTALGAGVLTGMSLAGFVRITARQNDPAPARRVVGDAYDGTTRVYDFADPGELRLTTGRDLLPAEVTTLDAALAAHLHTVLSAEQVREDQDLVDRGALLTAYTNWATLTATERTAALRLLLRLVVRSVGAAV